MSKVNIGDKEYDTMPLQVMKQTVNGNPYYQIMTMNPGGQTPSGYGLADINEAKQAYQKNPSAVTIGAGLKNVDIAKYFENPSVYDSGIVEEANIGGQNFSYASVDALQKAAGMANNPNYINIGSDLKPLYVPKGSSAEQLSTGQKTQEQILQETGQSTNQTFQTSAPVSPSINLSDSKKNTVDLEATATQRDTDKKNVLATYAANPNAIANDGFVNAAIQAALGRDASKDELGQGNNQYKLVGLSVAEVVKRLGLSTQAGATDVSQPDQISWRPGLSDTQKQSILNLIQNKPRDQWNDNDIKNYNFATQSSEPLSSDLAPAGGVSDKLGGGASAAGTATGSSEITDPIIKAYNDLIGAKEGQIDGEIDIDPILKSKQEAETAVEQARQLIADKQLIDTVKLDRISKDQPIPMSAILGQQQKYSSDQQIENLMNVQDYNNKLILSKISSGNLLEAQQINQQIASDKYQLATLMIDKMKAQADIDQQQSESLYKQAEYELSLSTAGYTPLTSTKAVQDATTQFGASRIWQDPVSKQYYLKPDTSTQGKTEWTKIGTDESGNDVYGFVNATNQTVSQYSSANASETGIVSTVTGDSYDIGSYATDPNHEASVQSILNNIGQFKTVSDIDNYIKSVSPKSPITGQMIVNASAKYGVSWEAIVAIMQQDSSLGTAGAGARSFNPGNVGNTETATSTGKLVNFGSWQAGVDAVAKNLAWRKTTAPANNTPTTAQSWADLINNGGATIANVPDKMKNQVVSELAKTPSKTDTTQEEAAKQKLALIDSLINDNSGLAQAVGPNSLLRLGVTSAFTGKQQNFIAGVQQLVSKDTLQTLLDLKKGGGTLGALSDQERLMLQGAATKIGTWAVSKDGQVVGYNVDEKSFRKELDTIKNLTQKAITSSTVPEIQEMADGTQWVQNADGTYTQIK